MEHDHWTPRESTLTEADLIAIAKTFNESHICRFQQVSPDDMAFIKDLLTIYKETRSEFIKWVVRGVVYGSLVLVAIFGYFKMKG